MFVNVEHVPMADVIWRKAAKGDVRTAATLMLEQAHEHVVGTEEDIGKAEGDGLGGDERVRSVDRIGGPIEPSMTT